MESPEPSLKEFLAIHEKTFHPAEYDVDINLVKIEEQKHYEALHPATVYTTADPETIPGFRVQALLTQEIDEASAALSNLETQLPQEYAYMTYDAPYYKIRIGNFTERTIASGLLKKLIALGYKDAWVVPDNILKNPPPKLPDNFIEPKRAIDNNR